MKTIFSTGGMVLAMVLAGCGGESDKPSSGGPDDAPSTGPRTARQKALLRANLKGIYQSMYTYTLSNRGTYPDRLGRLVEDKSAQVSQFVSPGSQTMLSADMKKMDPQTLKKAGTWVDASGDILSPAAVKSERYFDATKIILYEKPLATYEQFGVVYGDGNVSLLNKQQLKSEFEKNNLSVPDGL
ncbi:MAG: hypothetical protein R3236_08480 [Phycisphaeraceae bacterium]|nr:hypothetical protein [Phycisphaeraceae bacterium]